MAARPPIPGACVFEQAEPALFRFARNTGRFLEQSEFMRTRALIQQRFPSLSPTLQSAARFVVDYPNDVVTLSMRAIAERAGERPATFVRLAQSLGFEGWSELKLAIVDDLGLKTPRYSERAKSLAARGSTEEVLDELFVAQRENLNATETRSRPPLMDASKILSRAGRVYVAGFRASFSIAHSFFYGYRLFRDTVTLVDGSFGGLEVQLRPLQAGDAVVVVSFSPYSSEAIGVVEAARACGASVIALTDSNASPLALGASVVLPFSASSPSFFPSMVSAIALVEALLALLVVHAGDDGSHAIARAEAALLASHAYVRNPGA